MANKKNVEKYSLLLSPTATKKVEIFCKIGTHLV